MTLLAIETATELTGVAIAGDGGPLAATWVLRRRLHAESLAPMVEEVCTHAGTPLESIQVVAVDIGPGLFTGLRVGVAMANALAMARGVGVLGVPSFDVMAEAALQSGWRGELAVIIDARRGQVFVALFEVGAQGARLLGMPARCDPAELVATLEKSERFVLAAGDGAQRYGDQLCNLSNVRLAGGRLAHPSPAVLASLAVDRVARQGHPAPGRAVRAEYLRAPDVKVGWIRRAGS